MFLKEPEAEKKNLNATVKPDTPQKEQYYDLTARISERTVVYPGDPEFKSETLYSLETGSLFHLSQIHFGNHTGTHLDFPAHVIKNGKTSSDFPIEKLIGSGLILKVPDTEKSITKSFIETQSIQPNDFVIFKTANSTLSKQGKFSEKYVYIEPDAAKELFKKGVKIVGIDYISVDQYEAESLPVHHLLLSNDVLILEGLELKDIPEGRYKIYIMPINIDGMDGLPVRVLAEVP